MIVTGRPGQRQPRAVIMKGMIASPLSPASLLKQHGGSSTKRAVNVSAVRVADAMHFNPWTLEPRDRVLHDVVVLGRKGGVQGTSDAHLKAASVGLYVLFSSALLVADLVLRFTAAGGPFGADHHGADNRA